MLFLPYPYKFLSTPFPYFLLSSSSYHHSISPFFSSSPLSPLLSFNLNKWYRTLSFIVCRKRISSETALTYHKAHSHSYDMIINVVFYLLWGNHEPSHRLLFLQLSFHFSSLLPPLSSFVFFLFSPISSFDSSHILFSHFSSVFLFSLASAHLLYFLFMLFHLFFSTVLSRSILLFFR